MRPLIAGNWKMNGLGASVQEIDAVARAVAANPPLADVLICPPATLINRASLVARALARDIAEPERRIEIGGQDCHAERSGAFTGEVSAEMLKDAGATAVIVGHSERRQYFGETDAAVAAKVRAAWRAGLLAIVCVGETEAERDAGQARDIVAAQIESSLPEGASAASTAIAYEPIWAIGTGRTPSSSDIAEMHAHIRALLRTTAGDEGRRMRLLYGGSVNPGNARNILAIENVDGALVGGASLRVADILAIIGSVPAKH